MKTALKNINERMQRANQDPEEEHFDHKKRSKHFQIETPAGAITIFNQKQAKGGPIPPT